MRSVNGSRGLTGLILLTWHLLAGSAIAQTTVLDVSHLDPVPTSLSRVFAVLEDASLNLTLADVQKPEIAARFRTDSSAAESLGFAYTRSAYWLRVTLRNTGDTAVDRIFELAYARLSSVQWYAPLADGSYQSVSTGSVMPFGLRPYKNRHFVFPITLPAQSDQVYYLRLQSTSPLLVPARLWGPQAFHAYERNDYLAQAWYFGMATAMVLFNLLLFIALRDGIYLLYVFFVTSCALAFADQNGLVKEFLWPNSPAWLDFSTDSGYSIALLALLLFMRRMLNTKVIVPRTDGLIKILAGLFLISPLGFAISYPSLVAPAAVVYLLTFPLTLGIGVYCAVKGQRSAIFFLAAFSMLLLAGAVTSLRGWGLLPSNAFTVNALQIGSALEMLILAFALAERFNEIRREKAQAQREALQAQQRLVENLKSSERLLEERVDRRTAELQASNKTLESTLHDLKATQTQLVQSEKMASLGQLVANVAHEINTPISAVKSSGRNIADALDQALESLPTLFELLDPEQRDRFMKLINHAKAQTDVLSTREERAITRDVTRQLEDAGIDDARHKAGILVQLRAHAPQFELADTLPLLRHPKADFILDTAHSLATIISSTSNINTAVDRVSRIVFALKSFSRMDSSGEMSDADLREGIETVLTIYQSQIKQGTDLIRQYEDIPPLRCLPDELNQVWTNLIHNALQAMNHKGNDKGTLTVGIHQVGGDAVVSIGDSGGGIAEAIRDKIFDPFFTTKPAGEGSGLGLDIVRKIVDKHKGRIEIQTEMGVGSTFSVHLPY